LTGYKATELRNKFPNKR